VRLVTLAATLALAALGSGCSGDERDEPSVSPRTAPAPSAVEAEHAIRADSLVNPLFLPVRDVGACVSDGPTTTCAADYDDTCDALTVTRVEGKLVVARSREAGYCLHSAGSLEITP
jgi:hypothetical protein